MPTKSRIFSFILVSIIQIAILPCFGALSSEDALRYKAAHLLVFGNLPEKLPDTLPQGGIDNAIEICRSTLENASPSEQSAIRDRAWMDTMGTITDPNNNIEALTYQEHVTVLTNRLVQNPSEYEQVIRRAYPYVIYREAYDEEIAYWKQFPVMGYATLVGCLEDWARRNQPGLMVTGGTPTLSVNCEFLTTLRLNPAIANEVRVFIGLPLADSQRPNNVIAIGGESVTSSGGVHFLLVGSPDLRQSQ